MQDLSGEQFEHLAPLADPSDCEVLSLNERSMSFNTVGSLCSREVIVAAPDEPLRTAAQLMQAHRVGSVVICEDLSGRRIPVGIVTDRDIALSLLKHASDVTVIPLRLVMSSDLLVLFEDQDVSEALAALRARGVRRAPVVDAARSLVGIVSIDDLLGVIARQLGDMARLIERQAQ
jgi:CBS domain-containing protein